MEIVDLYDKLGKDIKNNFLSAVLNQVENEKSITKKKSTNEGKQIGERSKIKRNLKKIKKLNENKF